MPLSLRWVDVKAIPTTENSVDISGGRKAANVRTFIVCITKFGDFRAEYEGSIPFTLQFRERWRRAIHASNARNAYAIVFTANSQDAFDARAGKIAADAEQGAVVFSG
jgi:hypothetical protein